MKAYLLVRKSLTLACILGLALGVIFTVASAQEGGTKQATGVPNSGESAVAAPLTKHKLTATYFATSSAFISVSCSTQGCESNAPIFSGVKIVCPGTSGATCTYQIQIEAQVNISNFDEGHWRFFVDGKRPSPGPTGLTGGVTFLDAGPSSTTYSTDSRSFAVTAFVKNATANQAHTIEVDVGCFAHFVGCSGGAGFANLRIDVSQP